MRQAKVLVTGGNGFLGRNVVKVLKDKGYLVIAPTSGDYDLTNQEEAHEMLVECAPDSLINLAALCGGIGVNKKYPATFFYTNMMIGMNVLEACRKYKIDKTVLIGTVCSYPKFCPVPFKEEDLWNGYPEETNAPYGISKKAIMHMGQCYAQQYGMNIINLLPVNLYGPEDSLDLEKNHVIPALIKKFVDAKAENAPSVPVWGTGSASREFLYVQDAAQGIVMALEKYNSPEPVNLGSGMEITIKELMVTIKDLVGYSGEIVWDSTKPDGQPRRCLDVSKAKDLFGFEAETKFKDGLKSTVEWYKNVRGL